MEYFKFEVIANVRVKTEIKSQFPLISICNMNPLNSERFLEMMSDANMITLNNEPYFNLIALEEYQKNKVGSFLTFEQKKELFDMDGFVISCTFKNKPCNMSQLRYVYNPWRLNCIHFNSGYDSNHNSVPIYEVSVSGEQSELSMEFYVGLPDKMASQIAKRGFYVKILNHTEDPFKNTPFEMSVTPGYAMKLKVARSVFSQFNGWPYKYSWCNVDGNNQLFEPIPDPTLYNYSLSTNFTYNQDSCLLYCAQYYTVQVCNCSAPWINYDISGYETCLLKDSECINHFYYSVFNLGDYILEHCLDKCPLECDVHRFDNYQSIYAYPDPLYLENSLKKNQNLISRYSNQTDFSQNLAANVVKFSVFYDTLSYIHVDEEPKRDWKLLLSFIGGYLHLFLGMSILGFIEIVELVCLVLIKTHWKLKNRNKYITKLKQNVSLTN